MFFTRLHFYGSISSTREHRLIFDGDEAEKKGVDDATKKAEAAKIEAAKVEAAKKAVDTATKAPNETANKFQKTAGDTVGQMSRTVDRIAARFGSPEGRVQNRLTENNYKQAAEAVRTYNHQQNFSLEDTANAIMMAGFRRPTADEIQTAARNLRASPNDNNSISPPLEAGTGITTIMGTIGTVFGFFREFSQDPNGDTSSERGRFMTSLNNLNTDFSNTARTSLQSPPPAARASVTGATGEEFLVSPILPVLSTEPKLKAEQEKRIAGLAKELPAAATTAGLTLNTNYVINAATPPNAPTITVYPATAENMAKIRVLLAAISRGTQDDPEVKKKVDEAEKKKVDNQGKNKNEEDVKKKTAADQLKKVRDEAETAIRDAETTLDGAASAPAPLRTMLSDRVDALRKVVNDTNATTDALRKATGPVRELRTNFVTLRASYESADKVLSTARDRIAASTAAAPNDDVHDDMAQNQRKRVEAAIKDIQAALKTTEGSRMDSAKQELEKAITALEATCRDVRRIWGHNYLINTINATSEGRQGDVDRYSKQMGWTLMGDYMGMQCNRTTGQWQTGWWNGGRGPMDHPAGSMSFNYARYDAINTVLQGINNKTKPA